MEVSQFSDDIDRYLQKILALKDCYNHNSKNKGFLLTACVLGGLLDECAENELKSIATKLKEPSNCDVKCKIELCVIADAISYLTNDYLVRGDSAKRETLFNRVKEARKKLYGDILCSTTPH